LRFAEAVEEKMRDQLAVRREDFDALRSTVHELAEAQARTEGRVGRLEVAVTELAEAQKRTEQRVEELAEAQKRSEERIGRLEVAVAELAEAQKRTEQRVEELAEAQKRSEERIGRLEVAVAELAEAQKRSEERIGRLEVAVAELAEAQKRSEERIGRLEVAVTELAEAQKRTEQRIEELTEAQKRTERRMDEFQRMQLIMAEQISNLTDRMDRFGFEQDKQKGDRLERQYREKPFAYFGRILRRARVVPLQEIEEDLEQRLTEEELDELRPLDLLVRGRLHNQAQVSDDVWLALEVSAMVDRNDVERAQRRGAILRRAGYLAVSGVAGEGFTQGGVEAAQEEKVVLFRNGTVQFWEEALTQALADEGSAPGR
jgi:chromosome segregation ATPase